MDIPTLKPIGEEVEMWSLDKIARILARLVVIANEAIEVIKEIAPKGK